MLKLSTLLSLANSLGVITDIKEKSPNDVVIEVRVGALDTSRVAKKHQFRGAKQEAYHWLYGILCFLEANPKIREVYHRGTDQ